MGKQSWLINGTARGIGLELVRQLVGAGHSVVAVCRNPSEALAEAGATLVAGIDLADPAAPVRLAHALDALGIGSLDAIIMNAGIYPDSGALGALDYAVVHHVFNINTVAQLAVAEALLPRLQHGGRLAFITSRMGSIADNTSGGSHAYRMSKAALNMVARTLSVDLRPRGIAVGVIHPGFVRTDMTHGRGLIDADTAAAGIIARVEAMTIDTSGSFWHQNGDLLPW